MKPRSSECYVENVLGPKGSELWVHNRQMKSQKTPPILNRWTNPSAVHLSPILVFHRSKRGSPRFKSVAPTFVIPRFSTPPILTRFSSFQIDGTESSEVLPIYVTSDSWYRWYLRSLKIGGKLFSSDFLWILFHTLSPPIFAPIFHLIQHARPCWRDVTFPLSHNPKPSLQPPFSKGSSLLFKYLKP